VAIKEIVDVFTFPDLLQFRHSLFWHLWSLKVAPDYDFNNVCDVLV